MAVGGAKDLAICQNRAGIRLRPWLFPRGGGRRYGAGDRLSHRDQRSRPGKRTKPAVRVVNKTNEDVEYCGGKKEKES